MPSLCSSAPRLTPGASKGTMKQVKPVAPSTSPCTLANTKPTSAMPALVMNCLVPFSTHCVAVQHRRGARGQRVRAGARLGQAVAAAQLAAGEARQPGGLLRVAAEQRHRQRADAVLHHQRQHEGLLAAGALEHPHRHRQRQVQAAVFLGQVEHGQAKLGRLPHQAFQHAGRLGLDVGQPRPHLLVAKAPGGIEQRLVLGAEILGREGRCPAPAPGPERRRRVCRSWWVAGMRWPETSPRRLLRRQPDGAVQADGLAVQQHVLDDGLHQRRVLGRIAQARRKRHAGAQALLHGFGQRF